jgi:hypothetical protein
MFSVVLLVLALSQPGQSESDPADLSWEWRLTALRERVTSYLVKPGMTYSEVEKFIGKPFGVDSFGPPKDFTTVITYLASGISITFDSNGKVIGVGRE